MKQSLRAGSLSVEGTASIDHQFEALERICNNVHSNKYPRVHNSTASNIEAESCKILISEEALRYFENEREKGLFARFVRRDDIAEKIIAIDKKTGDK